MNGPWAPYLLVSNNGVLPEDQGDFEHIIQFNRGRGDRAGPLLHNGVEVCYIYELCLGSIAEVEMMERVLAHVYWAPNGTPTITERR